MMLPRNKDKRQTFERGSPIKQVLWSEVYEWMMLPSTTRESGYTEWQGRSDSGVNLCFPGGSSSEDGSSSEGVGWVSVFFHAASKASNERLYDEMAASAIS